MPTEHDPGPSKIQSSMINAHTTRTMPTEHDPGPSDAGVNTITVETTNSNQFGEIMTKRQLEKYVGHAKTMYKRKDKKIRPANVPLPGGVNPGGGVNLKSNGDNSGTSQPLLGA